MNTTSNTAVVGALKAALAVTKVNFSKSPRKGGAVLAVAKVPNEDGTIDKINALIEGGTVEGWELFTSTDSKTAGLKQLQGGDATASTPEVIEGTTDESAPAEDTAPAATEEVLA